MGTTINFMIQKGCDCEAHPIVRLVSMVLGPILGPIVGKLCQFLAVIITTVLLRRQAVYIFVAVILLYLWAAWYNISA
jgi:tetrahydromethanopterin S-methyltransferase subunit D